MRWFLFSLGLLLWECGGRELGGGGRLEEVREEKWLARNERKRLVGVCRGRSRVLKGIIVWGGGKKRSGRRG